MGFKIECISNAQNTGKPCFANIGRPVGHILVPKGTEIADEATAKTLSTWTTLFNNAAADRCYPLPKYKSYIPTNEEDVYETFDDGIQVFVRPGTKAGTKGMWTNVPPCFTTNLRSFNDGDWEAYTVTSLGYILGLSKDGTKFQPVDKYVRIEQQKEPTGDETWKTSIHIYDLNPEDWDNYGVAVKPTAFSALDLLDSGIVNVEFVEVSAAAGEVIVDAVAVCDNTPISGLVVGDFNVTGLASITSTGNRYTLTPTTTFASPLSIALKTQPDATTDGYESPTALTVTF